MISSRSLSPPWQPKTLLLTLAVLLLSLATATTTKAQVTVEPARIVPFPGEATTVPFPSEATTVPFPGQANTVPYPSQTNQAPSGPSTTCDYACMTRQYQEQYMREQCQASGNRQYYCKTNPLAPQQVDAIQRQGTAVRGQYGYWRNGIYYSNP